MNTVGAFITIKLIISYSKSGRARSSDFSIPGSLHVRCFATLKSQVTGVTALVIGHYSSAAPVWQRPPMVIYGTSFARPVQEK